MKCLLVSNLVKDVRCIGLLYIYEYIKSSNRHDVKLMFLPEADYDEGKIQELVNFIKNEGIEVVAFSVMTSHYRRCVKISAEIKKCIKNIKIVWGGIHPTIVPEECIQHVDYLCMGEGEVPMLELLDFMASENKELSALGNFWINNNGHIIKNNIRIFPETIGLPFPKYDWNNFYIMDRKGLRLFDRRAYAKFADWNGSVYSVIATRGCPFSCSYCCNSVLKEKMYGRPVKRRHLEDIIKELEYVKSDISSTRLINFQDDCFLSMNKASLEEFCNAYKNRVGLPFFIRSIPTYIDNEKIAMLKTVGLTGVSLGLQTADDCLNKQVYNRHVNSEDFLRAVKVLKKNNIWGVYDVLLYGPYDTDKTHLKTAELLLKLPKPFSINIFYMVLFPNTPLYQRCKKEDLVNACNDPYEVGFGKPRGKFYSEFVGIVPFMPRFILKYFLNNRKSKLSNLALSVVSIILLSGNKLRRYFESYAYNDKLVRKLFAIQTKLFGK